MARGMVQALQEKGLHRWLTMFCERRGWHDLEGLVCKFQNRVSFGVRAEIVELTTIPYIKGSRARALYKAGLRTLLAIAEASIPEIVKALFEFSSWNEQGDAYKILILVHGFSVSYDKFLCVEHMVDFKIYKDGNGNETDVDQLNINARDYFIPTQVHDELVLEVDPVVINEAALLLQTSMENAVSLRGIFLKFLKHCLMLDNLRTFVCCT
ncbi:hypothetical protein C1H46_021920 [Malus baccata]|uniref:DUF7898 domain-containing protein n=1 Tax=Malus baccata TaxID=106549 RepID=A0A540M1F0_MALBA|nr:hypothetical protein C1H46_021920 [Malus baccata]